MMYYGGAVDLIFEDGGIIFRNAEIMREMVKVWDLGDRHWITET